MAKWFESIEFKFLWLKALDTFGNCQRPVLSFGVSKHMHKIISLWNLRLNWSLKLQENDEWKKHPCCLKFVLSNKNKRLQLKSFNIIVRNYLFLINYVTSEGVVSHNVLYSQSTVLHCLLPIILPLFSGFKEEASDSGPLQYGHDAEGYRRSRV